MRGDASLLFLFEESICGYTISVGKFTSHIKKDRGNEFSSVCKVKTCQRRKDVINDNTMVSGTYGEGPP
jgi:hypothetical protein